MRRVVQLAGLVRQELGAVAVGEGVARAAVDGDGVRRQAEVLGEAVVRRDVGRRVHAGQGRGLRRLAARGRLEPRAVGARIGGPGTTTRLVTNHPVLHVDKIQYFLTSILKR